MVVERFEKGQGAAVLFSAGLDSAVLLARALQEGPAQPLYIRTGLAWETRELVAAEALLRTPIMGGALPLVLLEADVHDVYPATHWAIRGEAPGFHTPDEDVYLEGRNIILLSKAAVFMKRAKIPRVFLGPLAGNPFPDATPQFFDAMARALSLGLATSMQIETPFASMRKADVIGLGASLGVPFELTLSCMQPIDGVHCGRCSKCRERREAFREAGLEDPTTYQVRL